MKHKISDTGIFVDNDGSLNEGEITISLHFDEELVIDCPKVPHHVDEDKEENAEKDWAIIEDIFAAKNVDINRLSKLGIGA